MRCLTPSGVGFLVLMIVSPAALRRVQIGLAAPNANYVHCLSGP
jgi:hypothetical protein